MILVRQVSTEQSVRIRQRQPMNSYGTNSCTLVSMTRDTITIATAKYKKIKTVIRRKADMLTSRATTERSVLPGKEVPRQTHGMRVSAPTKPFGASDMQPTAPWSMVRSRLKVLPKLVSPVSGGRG